VELFHFDLSLFGEADIYITPGDEAATTQVQTLDGQAYSPYPIKLEGVSVSAQGPLPRPTLTIANTSGILTALVRNNSNFRGATVTRLVTFAKFLDDGSDPDPTSILTTDVFLVRRKVADNPRRGLLKFELGASMDLVDTYLPNRIVARDFCDHSYRVWNGSSFTYGTCPYTGTTYLDESDTPTTAANDACSKRLNGGCKARFGANAELPFRGFPGVARYRAR
jgi:lambda family phage minor tail protein L